MFETFEGIKGLIHALLCLFILQIHVHLYYYIVLWKVFCPSSKSCNKKDFPMILLGGTHFHADLLLFGVEMW